MMSEYMPADLYKRIEDRRRMEAQQYAANWRRGQAAKQGQPGWWDRQRCKLLCRVGHAMVRWGQRLQNSQRTAANHYSLTVR
jgi:hypothetical protein